MRRRPALPLKWLSRFGLAAFFLGVSAADPALAKSEWTCPQGFTPKEGLNTDFVSDGVKRAFVVVPPKNQTGAAPVWVPMVGTVAATNWNLFRLPNGEIA